MFDDRGARPLPYFLLVPRSLRQGSDAVGGIFETYARSFWPSTENGILPYIFQVHMTKYKCALVTATLLIEVYKLQV